MMNTVEMETPVTQIEGLTLTDLLLATAEGLKNAEPILTEANGPWNPSHNLSQRENMEKISDDLQDIFKNLNVRVVLKDQDAGLSPEEQMAYSAFKASFEKIYVRTRRLLTGIGNFNAGILSTPVVA